MGHGSETIGEGLGLGIKYGTGEYGVSGGSPRCKYPGAMVERECLDMHQKQFPIEREGHDCHLKIHLIQQVEPLGRLEACKHAVMSHLVLNRVPTPNSHKYKNVGTENGVTSLLRPFVTFTRLSIHSDYGFPPFDVLGLSETQLVVALLSPFFPLSLVGAKVSQLSKSLYDRSSILHGECGILSGTLPVGCSACISLVGIVGQTGLPHSVSQPLRHPRVSQRMQEKFCYSRCLSRVSVKRVQDFMETRNLVRSA